MKPNKSGIAVFVACSPVTVRDFTDDTAGIATTGPIGGIAGIATTGPIGGTATTGGIVTDC